MNFKKALEELRKKTKKRNFDQTLELIINLKDFDVKREAFSLVVYYPHAFKKKKVAAFLETSQKQEGLEKVIRKEDLEKISVREMKKIIKEMDFFIANAKFMPIIASKFGKLLSSSGKMPDPSFGGIITQEDPKKIKEILEKLNNLIKIRVKERSIKIPVGKESMKDELLIENLETVVKSVIEKLPKKEKNIKNILIKFTMGPTVEVK